MTFERQAGFSLLELVMVIIILSMSSIPILGQFTQVASSSLIDLEIQTAAQLAQERAEEILSSRRIQGYTSVPVGVSNEVLTGNYSGYSRSVVVSLAAVGECGIGANCKSVVISANRGPSNRAEITFILVDY